MGDIMTAAFRIGERVQFYVPEGVSVVAQIVESANKRGQVQIRILESPDKPLEGQLRSVPECWALRADGDPRAFVGGEQTWEAELEEIRDRVLRRLPHHLQPAKCSRNPRKELYLRYSPRWVGFHVWVHPRDLEVKLTLEIHDKAMRKRAYELLRNRQGQIKAALPEAQFNWGQGQGPAVSQSISWPGEEGPRPMDVDQTVDTLALYVSTLRPMLSDL
jgi:hypothetical protein